MDEFDRPQNKFLEEMYDDFLWLISSDPSAWDRAKERERQLEYNRKNAHKFDNIRSRKEYLERANNRHADKKKEATSYFDEDEPASPKKSSRKTKIIDTQEKIEKQETETNTRYRRCLCSEGRH